MIEFVAALIGRCRSNSATAADAVVRQVRLPVSIKSIASEIQVGGCESNWLPLMCSLKVHLPLAASAASASTATCSIDTGRNKRKITARHRQTRATNRWEKK